MKSYCEGTNCSRRDKCAVHPIEENKIYACLDWSTYGSGRYWNDPDGTPHCEVEHSCGDLGDFKHFIDAANEEADKL